jgi:hypothetical protein
MAGVKIKNQDGTYDKTFALQYAVGQGPTIRNLKTGKTLKPDLKRRVTLSCNGVTRRVNIDKVWSDTLESMLYPGEETTALTGNINVYLEDYSWKIPADADFRLGDQHLHQFTPLPRKEGDDNFIDLLTAKRVKECPPSVCTAIQLSQWSNKYQNQLRSLPDVYDLYRDLYTLTTGSIFYPSRVMHVIRRGDSALHLQPDGAISVSLNKGGMRTLLPTLSHSKLLTNNRLTFSETDNLISGPYTPLMTWAWRGLPYEDEVLFNVTGNAKDSGPSNYTWVAKEKVATYTQFRQWLTQRWYYENRR